MDRRAITSVIALECDANTCSMNPHLGKMGMECFIMLRQLVEIGNDGLLWLSAHTLHKS